MQVARGQIDQAADKGLELTSASSMPPSMDQVIVEPAFPPAPPTNSRTVMPPSLPLTSFVNPTTSEEESKKATAAAVAAKLTASTSSAQMFASVLSSLVAEEAALKSGSSKRPKLEKPMLFTNANNPEGANSSYFAASMQAVTSLRPVQSSTQSMSQANQLQAPFLPPPPPPPPPSTAHSPANQLVQSTIMRHPYGYGASNLPPQPLSSNLAMGLARPGPPPHQTQPQQQLQDQQPQSQQLQQQQQQQLPANGGYYRPVGIGFYGQSHQQPTPPIHRQ